MRSICLLGIIILLVARLLSFAAPGNAAMESWEPVDREHFSDSEILVDKISSEDLAGC